MTLAIFPCACARPSGPRHASCLRKLAKAEWILWSPTARPTDRPSFAARQAQEGHGRPRLTHSCLLAHQFYTGLITLQNLQPIIRNLILLSGLQVKLLFVGVADSAENIDFDIDISSLHPTAFLAASYSKCVVWGFGLCVAVHLMRAFACTRARSLARSLGVQQFTRVPLNRPSFRVFLETSYFFALFLLNCSCYLVYPGTGRVQWLF